ncbi:MAG: hypothetical protein B7Z66_11290 [Chromatiales bacterium 21-64-14]|nr:MAG: hypothetical protein B7Z66_11290 [Chromatiales bacterium 21-64-14]HQU16754.1 diiron oxygenase [Gammaproteobacteria bacterium]
MSSVNSTSQLHEQLNRNSTPYQDPLVRVGWDALSLDEYWLPESAVSLHGTTEYRQLPAAQRRRLSQFEYIHFLQAGLWLEGIFMERLGRSLRRPDPDLPRHIYRLHELREEAGHSLMFLELMRRSALPVPATRMHRPSLINLLGHRAPFHSVPFWIAVLIGEELPDRMNRHLRMHREEICATIYDMVTLHIIDEARHIAHVRDLLSQRLPKLASWRRAALRPLLRAALRQFVDVFYFPAPQTYEAAGLTPGTQWAHLARHNPARIRFVDETLGPTVRMLAHMGFPMGWR